MKIKKISVGQEDTFYTDTSTKKKMSFSVEAELAETDNFNEVYSHLRSLVESKFGNSEVLRVPRDCINDSDSLPDVDMSADNIPDTQPIIKALDPTNPNLQISCPVCGSSMVLRNGKKGKFWGCSSFSKTNCKGIVGLNQVEYYLDTGILPTSHKQTIWHNI